MSVIRALIVDDEEPGRINLRYALAEHAHWQVAGECASAAAARETLALADNGIDVVFLDIQMPNESGLALARELAQQLEPPLIVFVTAYNAYAVEAFEVHALDYLLKPFDDQRFSQTAERVQAMLAQRQRANYGAALRAAYGLHGLHSASGAPGAGTPAPLPQYWQRLSVRSVGRIECVQLEDVLWVEAAGNYVDLHMAARRVLHRVTLSRLEQHLDPACFLRVHRSAIVRVEQIARLEAPGDGSYRAALRCGSVVPVSDRHVAAVKARLAAA